MEAAGVFAYSSSLDSDSQLFTDVFMYQCRLFSVIDPSLGGEVGRLSTVESMVETGVVAKRECHNELPGLLGDLNTEETHNNKSWYIV